MRMRTRSAAAVVVVVGAMLAVFVSARALGDDVDKDWKILGEAKISRGQAEEIKVGGDEGAFKRIKLEVRGADVEFKNVTVVYESGDPEEVDVRDEVKRGSQTRPIDLKGGRRAIKKVLLAIKVDKDTDRDARIVLMGSK
jgi:hypothetical protein